MAGLAATLQASRPGTSQGSSPTTRPGTSQGFQGTGGSLSPSAPGGGRNRFQGAEEASLGSPSAYSQQQQLQQPWAAARPSNPSAPPRPYTSMELSGGATPESLDPTPTASPSKTKPAAAMTPNGPRPAAIGAVFKSPPGRGGGDQSASVGGGSMFKDLMAATRKSVASGMGEWDLQALDMGGPEFQQNLLRVGARLSWGGRRGGREEG
jgi:hypothetical protein